MDCIEIYYLNIDKILPFVSVDNLDLFLDKSFKSENRKFQYAFGRFLLMFGLKKYGVHNPNIIIKNKKPCLEDNRVCFSISHSKNIVMVAFYNHNIGVDIEYMKKRNYSKIFKYYGLVDKTPDKKNFYKFWTELEAGIKLQDKVESFYTLEFLDNFMLSVSVNSDVDIKNNLKITEIGLDDFCDYVGF